MSEENIQDNKMEEVSNDTPLSNGNKPSDGEKRDDGGKFISGTSGGPGRPKGSGLNLTSLLKEKLEEIPDGQKETYKVLFIKKILQKALVDGDLQAMKLVMNYVDGLPKQIIEGTFNNINLDYENLSNEQLKTRIGDYLERIGEESEEEGDS